MLPSRTSSNLPFSNVLVSSGFSNRFRITSYTVFSWHSHRAWNLFQLCDNCPLFSPNQSLGVRTIAGIESDCYRRIRIHRRLSIGSSRFKVAVFQEKHHDVFVVEVHRGGDTGSP